MMTSTALQRQRSSWPPTRCRPSMPTTIRKSTNQAIWAANTCSLKGNAGFIATSIWQIHVKHSRHVSLTLGPLMFSESWISTSSTRNSGKRGFKCGMKSTRAWWGDQQHTCSPAHTQTHEREDGCLKYGYLWNYCMCSLNFPLSLCTLKLQRLQCSLQWLHYGSHSLYTHFITY